MKNLYELGDVVECYHLAKSMAHFSKGKGIVTLVSHNTCQKGNDWEWGYQIDFFKSGTSSWYHHSNLKLCASETIALLTRKIKLLEKKRASL